MAAIEENLTSLQSDCSKAVVSAASVASILRAAAEFEGLSPMCVLHFSRHCGGFHIGLPLRTGSYFRNKSGSKWQCQRPWLTFERDVPLRYRRTDRHIQIHNEVTSSLLENKLNLFAVEILPNSQGHLKTQQGGTVTLRKLLIVSSRESACVKELIYQHMYDLSLSVCNFLCRLTIEDSA